MSVIEGNNSNDWLENYLIKDGRNYNENFINAHEELFDTINDLISQQIDPLEIAVSLAAHSVHLSYVRLDAEQALIHVLKAVVNAIPMPANQISESDDKDIIDLKVVTHFPKSTLIN